MSKTILAHADGFTPVIDGMIPEVGAMTALIFGKAWRYCQMSDGVCKAAQDRIADELGLSRATVNTHFAKLVESGYLEDLTPNLLGFPHEYKDTGRANLSISLTGGVKNIDRGCQNSLQGGVKNIDTKIVLKKELKKEKIKPAPKAKPTTPPEVVIFREVTSRYPNKVNYPDIVSIIESVSVRLQRPCTADDLLPFFAAWTARGFNPANINWTSWAVTGIIPQQQGKQKASEPKAFEAIRQFMQSQGAINGNTTNCLNDDSAFERGVPQLERK